MELIIRATITSALLWPIGGWALMLILGIAHYDVSASIPALGFWLCLALIVLGSFVKSAVAPSVPEDSK